MKRKWLPVAIVQWTFTALLLTGVMSCSKEGDDIIPYPPDPPMPPVEMKDVTLKAEIIEPDAADTSVVFVSRWNDAQCVLAVPLHAGRVVTRTSVIEYNPMRPLFVKEGFGSKQALLSGSVVKTADSVAVFKSGKDLLTVDFINRNYGTDSLPDLFRFDDILYGTARLDSTQETEIKMRHITSILDVRLENKTGIDLAIKKVTIYPSDPACVPFFRSFRFACFSYGKQDEGEANMLTATYSKGRLVKDGTFTVRHPLFLVNDSILNKKAMIYSIHTDHGVYTYTKSGRIYEGGKRHVEELVIGPF